MKNNRWKYVAKVENKPNGWNFIKILESKLNSDTYKIRIRGSRLNPHKIQALNPHHTPQEIKQEMRHRNNEGSMKLEYCDYLRVYLDTKKD